MTQQPCSPRTIHFDIGRITLHGYSPGQRDRFVGSLRARLAALAAGNGHRWPDAARRIGQLDGGVLRAGAAPEEAAERIAASLVAVIASARTEAHGRAETGPANRPGERND
jgi:hypothetical protein